MSDIQQRIADILRQHQKGFFGDQYGNCAACTCGWKGAGWTDHVAEMVVKDLGLNREWAMSVTGVDLNDGRPVIIECDDADHAERLRRFVDKSRDHAERVSRYVTAWAT